MYSKKLRNEFSGSKISIVTVSYNAAKTIERTIESVARQSYESLEYIVIDGASTDQTAAILDKHRHEISVLQSEPDDGIYDAMNKGIRYATGDYLYFLGADDWLCNNEVMREVSAFIDTHPGFSFYMGNVLLHQDVHRLVKRKRAEFSEDGIKRGDMCPHQGLFADRRLMKEGFDTKYRIAADYEFLLRNILQGENYCTMDIDVAYYSIFGASADHALYDEYIAVIKKYAGEECLDRIYALQENEVKKCRVKNLVKKLSIALLGEKNFLRLRGWKPFDEI